MEFMPDGLRAMNVTLQYVLHDAFGVYADRLWSGELGPMAHSGDSGAIRGSFTT